MLMLWKTHKWLYGVERGKFGNALILQRRMKELLLIEVLSYLSPITCCAGELHNICTPVLYQLKQLYLPEV